MKNYHTHTNRCMHATGSDEDYVLAAINSGYTVLGFSDHSPWKYGSDFVANMRMHISEFDNYYQSISQLKQKYKGKIEIKIGLECEYFPKYMKWLEELSKEYQLDYLIFGNHYYETDELRLYYGECAKDDEMLDNYVKNTIEGLNTGLYCYLAHPDVFMRSRIWDEKCKSASHQICSYCKEHNVIIEYNLAGLRASMSKDIMEYPHDEFWKIAAKHNNKVIIGIDAHSPEHLSDISLYNQVYEKLINMGLEIVDDIECNHYE